MIKVSFIAPTSLMEEYGNQGDFHLALAHLLGPVDEAPNAYEKALIESGLPIYLDNGLFENGKSVDVRDLMKKAVHLNAKYVFAPDVLYQRLPTESNVEEAYQTLQEIKEDFPECETRLAAVVQANNPQDFKMSYLKMANNSRVALIGLSILSIPESYKDRTGTDDITANRVACLKHLSDLPFHKPSHLLGLGSSYRDVKYAQFNCPWVVSHDSSSAVWNGVQEKDIEERTLDVSGGKTKVHVDFNFNDGLSNEQRDLIQHNINVVKRITRYDI